jgi:uncharacterized protein YeaO (DUF488 family)
MTVHIVRLGAPRLPNEGPRIGTVRRPPRRVRKEAYASENWFDVWYPELSPSPELMAKGQAAETDKDWAGFVRAFRAEMKAPAAARTLDVLATLSQTADFAIGCYCAEEARCHRSVLREELAARGAKIA